VAHDIHVTAWYLVSRDQPYCDPGATVLQERTAEQLRRRAIRQLEHLGHTVTLEAV
jgi:transposase